MIQFIDFSSTPDYRPPGSTKAAYPREMCAGHWVIDTSEHLGDHHSLFFELLCPDCAFQQYNTVIEHVDLELLTQGFQI